MYLRRLGILISLSALLLAGCATPQKLFERAELAASTDPAAAIKIYSRILQHAQAEDPRFVAKVRVRRGDMLLIAKDPQTAFEDYQHATQIDPKNAEAHLRSANLLLMAGATDRASEEANAVLRLEPGNPEALAVLGVAALSSGRMAEGKALLKQVLSKRPDRVDIAVIVAELEATAGSKEEARRVLAAAAQKNPKDARPRLALGRMAEEEGDNRSAEQDYRQAVASDDAPEANLRLAQFLERTTRFPESAAVLAHVDLLEGNRNSRLADFALASGQGKRASEQYRMAMGKLTLSLGSHEPDAEIKAGYSALAARIIEADLQSAATDRPHDHVFPARLHLQQFATFFDATTMLVLGAEIAMVEGDLQTALSQANSAVVASPESAPAHFVLASASERNGDPARAKAEIELAVAKDPAFVPARLMAAEQALAGGNPDAAEVHVAMVVRGEPANLPALLLYARTLRAQKRYLPAMLMARRALAVDASSSEAYCIMGQIDTDTRDAGNALIDFERAVLLAPRSHEAIQGLVNVYRFGQVTRPMLRKMEKVANNPPRSAPLMETAGRLYAQHRWYDDATRCLRAAAAIDPERAPALTALARTYLNAGNTTEAKQAVADADRAWAEMLQGSTAQDRSDMKTAMHSYESALQHGENSGATANNLAWLYAQQSINLDRALELAKTAHQLLPRDLGVMDTLGYVYLRRREYNEAIKTFESALDIEHAEHAPGTSLPELRQNLAEAYRQAGRTSDAAALSR